MLKLDSTINLNVGDFFHWWWGEIKTLLPEQIRKLLIENQQLLVAYPEGDKYRLTHRVNGRTKELGVFESGEIGKVQFNELIEKVPELAKIDLILRLPRQDAVIKQFTLPEVAAENLDQVVQYELDRLTPFKPEQVYFSVMGLDKKTASGQIRANLIITPREKLEIYYKGLKDWGGTPAVVDYEGAPNDFEKKRDYYNLLPESLRIKKNRIPGLIVGCLAFLVFFLLCMIFIVPVWMEYRTVNILEEQITRVEKEARTVDNFKTEIDNLYTETRDLIERKKSTPSAVEILNTVSQLITDDTWLTHLQYSGGNVQIQGQSPAASSLIGALETSALFDKVRFVSPVTQDKKTGLERFQITAHIVEGVSSE